MPKYNIYRIHNDRTQELISKLESVGMEGMPEKDVDGFSFKFFLSSDPEDAPIWWIKLYQEFLPSGVDTKFLNRIHFAALLISNSELSYAISMGKTHFYLKEYCDLDFGVNLAERIIDEKSIKMKNSRLFGGRRIKTINSYQANSELEFESGESILFLKGKSLNQEIWGSTINCGNSVLFNVKFQPEQLPAFLQRIETELSKEPNFKLPRSLELRNPGKIDELDDKLILALRNRSETSVGAIEESLSGVDFIFLNKEKFTFSYSRKRYELSELTADELMAFLQSNQIELTRDSLNRIKVKVEDEYGKGYTKPLKYFIDYTDEERHYLCDGKWYQFNQDYIDYLIESVDKIRLDISPANDFDTTAFKNYLQSLSPEEANKAYKERFFNQKKEDEGMINLDRRISTIRSRYKIEKADLYQSEIETLYFVKIGSPQKLSYVVDQAINSLRILQHYEQRLELNGISIRPKALALWLILAGRSNRIEKVSELRSLIFLVKLSEWSRQVKLAGFDAFIKIGYEV